MPSRALALDDFERARRKAFWRKVFTWLTGESNKLLPFDDFRESLPIHGQHHLGFQEIPIDKIIGSMGRFRDFDRAFLPVQKETRDRWISIDSAHYEDVHLPPVDLYKMGDVYFVKDGNHRVSVARERGALYVDAFVTEIEIPVPLTIDTEVDDLEIKREYAEFLQQTNLTKLRPGAKLETSILGQYTRLMDHVAVHRWYMAEQKGAEVSLEEAVGSWYDHIYLPLVEALYEKDLVDDFQKIKEVDLYLWIMEYQAYLRQAYRYLEIDTGEDILDVDPEDEFKEKAGKQVIKTHPSPSVKKLVNILKNANWIDELIINQERAAFYRQTKLEEYRPHSNIETKIPGQYHKLLEHIAAHRWYMGERRGSEVPYDEAVRSWYDTVYLPLVSIIREQDILDEFTERTETDLYLWIITRQWLLRKVYDVVE